MSSAPFNKHSRPAARGRRLVPAALAALLTVAACGTGDRSGGKEGRKLARVYNKFLYETDLSGVFPAPGTSEDSAAVVRAFIENWIRQELVTRKAELNLDRSQKDVEKLIENYRRDLVQYIYKKELVRQKLDTVVTDEEIAAYYGNNMRNFGLKDNIVRVAYARFPKGTPGLDKVRKWYRSGSGEDFEQYKNHCHSYAASFFLNDSTWLLLSDVAREVPVDEREITGNRFIEKDDSAFVYFVAVKEVRIKESTSPLSYEAANIRELILNKRKIRLLQSMEQNLYLEAVKKNDFEIYE